MQNRRIRAPKRAASTNPHAGMRFVSASVQRLRTSDRAGSAVIYGEPATVSRLKYLRNPPDNENGKRYEIQASALGLARTAKTAGWIPILVGVPILKDCFPSPKLCFAPLRFCRPNAPRSCAKCVGVFHPLCKPTIRQKTLLSITTGLA